MDMLRQSCDFVTNKGIIPTSFDFSDSLVLPSETH
jgi:hypothetical protein